MRGATNNSSPEQISQLNSANRLKTELIANVSHELRTPVHAIIGYAELLLEGVYGSLTDHQKETLNYIRESASDLLSLISNLLDISKIESGKADLILGTFDLRDLITELFGQLKPLADAKELMLDSKVLVNDTVVRSDRGKLKQVLTNILGNALKFTDRGSVTLTVEPAGHEPSPLRPARRDQLQIRVQDTGIGIAADKLDRIFEKFYQINSSANRAYGGAGLGLYITKQLLDLLAGTINVESTPRQGTVVTVSLPRNFEELEGIHRLRRRIADASTGLAQELTDGSRLVLVVSDNPDTARILSDGLSSAEYNVYVSGANSEAVALAKKLCPIVILLNSEASSTQFWSVFQELKSQPETKDIPTIFLGNDGAHGLGAPLTVAAPLKRHEVLRSIRAVTKTGKKNVLIVDDDESFREILKCALSDEGYQISEAETGTRAIELLTNSTTDVVLLDLHIPEMDGWDVLRFITQSPELKEVEVLVISGDMLDDKEAAMINARSSGFICKADFKVNAVLERVAHLLEVN